MTGATMTPTEMDTFSAKIERFAQGLSPSEQPFFLAILARAASAGDDDVEGHMFDPALMHLLHHTGILPWHELQYRLHAILHHLTNDMYRPTT